MVEPGGEYGIGSTTGAPSGTLSTKAIRSSRRRGGRSLSSCNCLSERMGLGTVVCFPTMTRVSSIMSSGIPSIGTKTSNRVHNQAKLSRPQNKQGRRHARVEPVVLALLDDAVELGPTEDGDDHGSSFRPLVTLGHGGEHSRPHFGIANEQISPRLVVET